MPTLAVSCKLASGMKPSVFRDAPRYLYFQGNMNSKKFEKWDLRQMSYLLISRNRGHHYHALIGKGMRTM